MEYVDKDNNLVKCYFKGRFDNVIIFGEIFKLGGLKPEILRQGVNCKYILFKFIILGNKFYEILSLNLDL